MKAPVPLDISIWKLSTFLIFFYIAFEIKFETIVEIPFVGALQRYYGDSHKALLEPWLQMHRVL